ncbi:MAG: UDP-glucose 4-epimerase GalE [Gammaproteobacteria bacterium]|nr:UDP-glucose 4-epimerase GalE [Gammaproteobacteria bacterium]
MIKHPPKILITGGAGYIGSHMLIRLIDAGYRPIVLDNLSSGLKFDILNTIPYYQFDINNVEKLDALFSHEKIDLVMHFAGSLKVAESIQNPDKYYYNNFVSTLSLLKVMKKQDVTKLIFSSTAAIFGNPIYASVDEKHPKNPINSYGSSKLMCEMMLRDFDSAYGIQSVCLRYFNPVSADPKQRVGFHSEHCDQLIPRVLSAAMGKSESITIFGTDYETRDGTCIRDYTHVMDLCDAHLLALHYLQDGGPSTAFNLGNGQGYSVLDVINIASKVASKDIKIIDAGKRAGESAVVIAASDFIKNSLGWMPKYTDLELMIQHAWNWEIKKGRGESVV